MSDGKMPDNVHMAHCDMEDYEGSCKYGEEDTCPALKIKDPLTKQMAIERQYFTVAELREIWEWLETKAITVVYADDVMTPSDRFAYIMLKPHYERFMSDVV
jgi:hypothetical protein